MVEPFIEKFYYLSKKHEINRRKVSAIHNFSLAHEKFSDWYILKAAKKWINFDFLDWEREKTVDDLLQKYNIDWLDWYCKTPWVKKQIAARHGQYRFTFKGYNQEVRKLWRNRLLRGSATEYKLKKPTPQ